MTKALMDWNRLRLEVKGHAGYAEEGKDIVCAGVSVLICALNNVLEEAMQRGRLTYRARDGDGEYVVSANPGMGSLNETKAYFRFAARGLKDLAEQYPKHVEIVEIKEA